MRPFATVLEIQSSTQLELNAVTFLQLLLGNSFRSLQHLSWLEVAQHNAVSGLSDRIDLATNRMVVGLDPEFGAQKSSARVP